MINSKLTAFHKNPYFIALLITIFIFLVYLPSLNTFLMGDDFEWLDSVYSSWQNPLQLLQPINNFFRPLVKFSYLINYSIFKNQVLFYNLSTILFHLINVFLLYLLILKITLRILPASLIAILYGFSAFFSEVTLWSAGRPDSLLLIFLLSVLIVFNDCKKRYKLKYHILVSLLTLGAIASKETWLILPLLLFGFLWLVKGIEIKFALKKIVVVLGFSILYMGIFIIIPIIFSNSSFTSYSSSNIIHSAKKFGLVISKYMGLDDVYTGAYWQILLILIILISFLIWFIKRRNNLAIWGMLWMLIAIGITLPIYHSPSRYNYIPLVGFWIMVVAWLEQDLKTIIHKFKLKKPLVITIVGTLVFICVLHHVIMLQWEIKDYRLRGAMHKELVDMYEKIKKNIPYNRPIVFVDKGKRKAVSELNHLIKGYRKLLFVRKDAIWQQIYISPLVNYLGNPFSIQLQPVPNKEINKILKEDFCVLIFTDEGFNFDADYKKEILGYYNNHKRLPPKVQALKFVPVKEKI